MRQLAGRVIFRRAALQAWALLLSLLSIGAAGAQERIELATRPGVTQPVLATTVAKPAASLVLFPGGSGVVAQVRGNFLLRIAPALVRQGFSVYVADAPSDQAFGMRTSFRLSAEHAQDIAAIVALGKSRSPAPVWLIGTSRGTASAANGAARLGQAIDGLVLTSSIWADGMAGIPFAKLAMPVLIVHSRDDGCQASPFSGTDIAMRQLVSPHALVAVSGGQSRGDACGGASPHGYLGIEDQVITPMVAFIRAH